MIVTVFVIFLFLRDIGRKRKHDNNSSCIRIKDLRGNNNFDTLITSIDESSYAAVSQSHSDTISGNSSSLLDDKLRNDSLSVCSDIFAMDPKPISEEIRIPARKNFTKPFRKYGQRIFTRRRRTTGRYIISFIVAEKVSHEIFE
jgi:hypothetical protein